VADSVTDHLRAHTGFERARGVRVPKIVEGDPGESDGRGEAIETLPNGVGVRWATVLEGEDVVARVIVAAKELTIAVLDAPPGA
jgi:hypothetical protein